MSTRKKILFSILATFLFLLMVEGVSRFILMKKYGSFWVDQYHDIFAYADGMRFRHTPNTNLYYSEYYGSVKTKGLRTDSEGFIITGSNLEREIDKYNKPDIRVVIFGGSTLAGFGATDNSQTIPSHLETLLQSHYKDKSVEVINAGVGSYRIRQELMYYLLYMSDYNPDLVITFNGVNDRTRIFFPSNSFERDDWVDWLSQWQATLQASTIQYLFERRRNIVQLFIDFLITPNNIWRTPEVAYRLSNTIVNKKLNVNKKKVEPEDNRPYIEQVIDSDYWKTIRRFERILRDENVKYLAVLQPHPAFQKPLSGVEKGIPGDYLKSFNMWMSHLSESAEVQEKKIFGHPQAARLINLIDAFKDVDEERYVDTCHYNDIAQKELAQKIFPHVIDILN